MFEQMPIEVIDLYGDKAFDSGDYLTAYRLYKNGLKKDPNNLDFLFSLGSCMTRMGKQNFALQFLNSKVESHPNNPDLHEELGNLAYSIGNLEASLNSFKKAFELTNGEVIGIQRKLSIVFLESGFEDDGFAVYRDIISKPNSTINDLIEYSKICIEYERYEESREILDNILTKEPENLEFLSNEESKLSSVEKDEEDEDKIYQEILEKREIKNYEIFGDDVKEAVQRNKDKFLKAEEHSYDEINELLDEKEKSTVH